MAEWEGVPYFFDVTDKLPEHFSVMVDKIPQIIVETSFSWDVALSGFLAGCVPAFIAWVALRNSKKDNEKNRMATLDATKKTVYAQTKSERIRKNTDTVTTLVAHFMGYCTKFLLLLGPMRDFSKHVYAENRLELVLIRNKLSILLLPEKIANSSEFSSYSRDRLLGQIELLLDITEYYVKYDNKYSDRFGFVTKEMIEKEINNLVSCSTYYIDEKLKELEGELL